MKDVIISIKSSQGIDVFEEDAVEFVTEGKYSFLDGIAEFDYMESSLTGLEGTHTKFTAGEEEVTITRDGTVTSQMIFKEGEKNYFLYELPFGSTSIGLYTKEISCRLNENGGDLEIRYFINMENAVVSRNSFKINIKEAVEQI